MVKQMRILTTLLVLLLSSPVFAETWVCSYESGFGIATHTYARTDDGFEYSYNSGFVESQNNLVIDIVFEDSRLIVLHHSITTPLEYGDYLTTQVVQLEKNGRHRFRNAVLHYGLPLPGAEDGYGINEGTCTVVE
mgnify:CR=1 FL=1